MSITEFDKIDGMGVEKNGTLVFLMTDALTWDKFEKTHIEMIIKKLNQYIRFIQTGGYKSYYPDEEFKNFRIELKFKYACTAAAQHSLKAIAEKMQTINIQFVYEVAEDKNKRG